MFAQIFAVIELILKLIGLWDGFMSYVDKKRIADEAQKTADRNKAVDEQKNAKSEDDFDKAQDDIIRNKP